MAKAWVALADTVIFIGIKFSVKFLFPVGFKMAYGGSHVIYIMSSICELQKKTSDSRQKSVTISA